MDTLRRTTVARLRVLNVVRSTRVKKTDGHCSRFARSSHSKVVFAPTFQHHEAPDGSPVDWHLTFLTTTRVISTNPSTHFRTMRNWAVLIFLQVVDGALIFYDVYLQLAQLRSSSQLIPYRSYEMRWEIECTTDDRQLITKYPNAFAIDDYNLVFFDPQLSQRGRQQEQQTFVYVRRVQEMAVVCFRLYYRNDLALEDCLVVDVRTSDFADVRYSTKTRAHGTALTYQAQVTPSNGLYLLLLKNENNETVSNSTADHGHTRCVASTTIAAVEAVLILLATAAGLGFYLLKSNAISLANLKRKRLSLGTVRLGNKIVRKTNVPKIDHARVVTKQLEISVTKEHYRAPSATSADSGTSTLSNGSTPSEGKNRVPIYDDPPDRSSKMSPKSKKNLPVQDFIAEMWRRNRPTNAPPPPPLPDYRNRSEDARQSQSIGCDLYAALEDPNNWDPPERFCSHDSKRSENSNFYSNDDSDFSKS